MQKQTSVCSKNYVYLTSTGPYRFRITEYSGLSDGTQLPNILDHQMVPILTEVLTGSFLLLLLYLVCTGQPITGVFHLDISFICWSRDIRVSYVFWGYSLSTRDAEGPGNCLSLLIAKEVDRVGDTIKSRMLSTLKLQDLGTSSSSTKVSGFLE